MSLDLDEAETVEVRFPRVSGDEPLSAMRSMSTQPFSPRERG